MHTTPLNLIRAVFALAVLFALCAASAKACPPGTVQLTPGSSFGVSTCNQTQSGLNFVQNGFCVYFPNGDTTTPDQCDPTFCGTYHFLLPKAGTFTASVSYPSPGFFNIVGLQLC